MDVVGIQVRCPPLLDVIILAEGHACCAPISIA